MGFDSSAIRHILAILPVHMGSGFRCNVPAGWVLQNRYIVEPI